MVRNGVRTPLGKAFAIVVSVLLAFALVPVVSHAQASSDGTALAATGDTGTLVIEDQMEGGTPKALDVRTFTHVIRLSNADGSKFEGKMTWDIVTTDDAGKETVVSSGSSDSGSATVNIKAGQKVRATVPAGANYQVSDQGGNGQGITTEVVGNAQGTVTKGDSASITYNRTYKSQGTFTPAATVSLKGETLSENQFGFTLADENGKEIGSARNAEDGTVTFKDIVYTNADDGKAFTYKLSQNDGGNKNMTYDDHVFDVVVKAVDNGYGKIDVTVTYDGQEAAAFSNTYTGQGGEGSDQPTLVGQVFENRSSGEDAGWHTTADAGVDEDVQYRADGTLPANWDEVQTYLYEFDVTVAPELTVDSSSVKVELFDSADLAAKAGKAKADLTQLFRSQTTDGVLKVVASDLKKAAPQADADDVIRLSYTAKISGDKVKMGTDNPMETSFALQYGPSADENTPQEAAAPTAGVQSGKADGGSAHLLSWGVNVFKVDSGDEKKALSNARFTLKDEKGQYVAENGTRSDQARELTTSDNGSISIKGLDSGTYTLEETAAPQGYSKIDGAMTVKVDSDLEDDKAQLKASVDGNQAISVQSADTKSGISSVQVKNTSGAGSDDANGDAAGANGKGGAANGNGSMPKTGDILGILATVLGTAAIGAGGAAYVARRRMKAQK